MRTIKSVIKRFCEKIYDTCDKSIYCFRGFLQSNKFKKRGKRLKIGKGVRFVCRNYEITAGNHVTLYRNVKISVYGNPQKTARLHLEDDVSIGNRTELHAGDHICIGKGTLISWDCCIMDRDYHKLNSDTEKTLSDENTSSDTDSGENGGAQ